MPGKTRRVIVLSTEAFERLRESKLVELPLSADTESEQTNHTDKDQDSPRENVKLNQETLEEHPATPYFEPAADSSVEPKAESSSQLDPLQGFPARYLKDAEATLARLQAIEEISWDSHSGCLSLSGQRCNLSLAQLLRTICVPFTKVRLPPACVDLLTRYQIKPRNHLLLASCGPKWHMYFKL